MTLFNEVSTAIALVVGGVIIWLIRRQRIGVYQTALWLGAVFCLILFGIFPSILDWLGGLLGVHYPPVLLIIVSLCILLVKLLTLEIQLTRHETRIRVLTQKMAAYEARLMDLGKDGDKTDGEDR
ncbi:hypothetical protein DND132_0210 [Pseudodesulfovibrio mercurii]|uniref:DUF2304 domain-containing protein n=1 Tax=Pseudodesulfovibrio mercurii TaxID=641491 RepID=F0JDY7_9BACT|nr:DUF2304 domain-containing protein [Pseudodesulfovibrio mercurii]EGB13427.1 hypothetical protein DND132_0210 [Pseudodesulfovibrio mercurii]